MCIHKDFPRELYQVWQEFNLDIYEAFETKFLVWERIYDLTCKHLTR